MSDWRSEAEPVKDWRAEAEPVDPPTPRAPQSSMAESALQGYGQGASFGFSDELGGVVHEGVKQVGSGVFGLMKTAPGRALVRRLVPGLKNQPDFAVDAVIDHGLDEGAEQTLGSTPRSRGGPGADGAGYAPGRAMMRREVSDAQRANPKTFFAGSIAGAMSVPSPGGGPSNPFQTVGGRSLQNMGSFGASGALAGLGNSDADLLKGEFGQAATDTAIGAGIGAGMGSLTGPAAYGWARHARPALQSMAASRAVAAVAPSASLANKMRTKLGIRTDAQQQQLGEEILDLGILRPFGGAAGANERNQAIQQLEGANIGSVMERADNLVEQGVARGPSRDLQRGIVSRSLADAADTPVSRAALPAVEARLLENTGRDPVRTPEALRSMLGDMHWWDAEPPATFREMWKNKSQLQSALKPDEFSSEGQKLYNRGVGGYTRGVYNQVESAVGPDELANLRQSTRRFGTSKKIDDFLVDQTTRKSVNQPIGMGDAMRGAAMEGTIPGGGGVAMLISALMRGRTDSTIATGARSLSRMRPNMPSSAIKGGSEATRQVLSDDEEDAVQAFLKGN